MRNPVSPDSGGPTPLGAVIRAEQDRSAARRQRLQIPDASSIARGHWALALSGGGIRSATFALGVMQGLARIELPESRPGAGGPASDRPAPAASLLAQFDYLSTVSGGGYIGAFFCSLFVPGRLRKGSTPEQAAAEAHRVLAYEPPTRMHSSAEYTGSALFSAPTAWLRESGRYLTPTGAGDMVYAAAVAIRNWFSVQYVLATLFLTALALLALLRSYLAYRFDVVAQVEDGLLTGARLAGPIWWSPLWAVPVLVATVLLLPLGIAFWMSFPDPGRSESDRLRPLSRAARYCIVICLAFIVPAAAMLVLDRPMWHQIAWASIGAGAVTLEALLAYWVHIRYSPSVPQYRVVMTRHLADGCSLFVVATVLACADTLGQSLYLDLSDGNARSLVTPTALAGAATWLIRHLAGLFEGKDRPAWLAKASLNLIAGAAGMLLLTLIATLWALLVQWIRWHGVEPAAGWFSHARHVRIMSWASAIFGGLAFICGRFPAFINLSTLHSLFAARLTRAYLGASNGERFGPGSESRPGRSVAEPLDSDQLDRTRYYADDVLAPVHLINVTVNQTVDPAEQLVQRDRKGQPLCVGPGGFSVDGRPFAFRPDGGTDGLQEQLTVGQWISASGAAIGTALGRTTSLGIALVLGLANLRLGIWWPSGYGKDRSPAPERAFKATLRTQTFLLYEMMGRFYGLHREWQYLSDGGHFENTALYELLRPEREVGLIVICDSGADPEFRFGDLANLIRLARIDLRIEIEVDRQITQDPELHRVFGAPEDFDAASRVDDRCAILLNVYRPKQAPGQSDDRRRDAPALDPPRPGDRPDCRIVLLKPRRLSCLPLDVQEYAARHPAFPHESSADQSFDEAQWESYRRLGYGVGQLVFGSRSDDTRGVGDALWRYLQSQKAAG